MTDRWSRAMNTRDAIRRERTPKVTADEYYELDQQLVAVRRRLQDLEELVGRLDEKTRMLRYDLDVLNDHR